MSTKSKIVTTIIVLVVTFAFGRYTTPVKVVTKVETVEVEKKTSNTDTDSDAHKHKETTTTKVTRPDGTTETTTKSVEDTTHDQKTSQQVVDNTTVDKTSSKEVIKDSGRLNLSILAGVKAGAWTDPPVYGGSINKNLIGPITIGLWGLTNGTVGGSLGVSL